MLIATFTPSTGWNGKTITYERAEFLFEGYGPIGPPTCSATAPRANSTGQRPRWATS